MMFNYSEEFKKRVLKVGKYSVIGETVVFLDLTNYEEINCFNEALKREREIAKKYRLNVCEVVDVATNSESDYIVKFKDSNTARVCNLNLWKAVHKETGEALEDFANGIDYNIYKLKRV